MEAGGEAEGASSGILEDASIAVLVLDGGAQVVQTLGRARDLTGIEAGDGIAAAPGRLREALEAALAHPGRSEVVALDGRMLEIRCDPARPSFVIAVDVTTHLREHQDARRRERQLRLMFAQVPAAAWATDRDLRITHVLGQVAREIGLDERSIPGMSIFDVTGARDATDPAVAHHRAALLGERSSFRYVLAERCYDVHVAPLRDDRDQIVGCVGAAVDVTARARAERRIAASEEALAESQALAHVGNWHWEIERDRVTLSDEMHRIFGVGRTDFAGSYDALIGLVHPDDRESAQAALFEALRSLGTFEHRHRIVRPDGTVRVLHTRGRVHADEGRPVRVSGACSDVTEQVEATRALERTVSLLEATIESTEDGLLVVDLSGRVSAYNQRFLSLWRVPPSLAARRDDRALLTYVSDQLEDPEAFLRNVQTLYGRPAEERLDVLRFKDGRVFERYSRAQRVAGEVVGRVWSFRDVTERERALTRATFLADAGRLLTSLDAEQALDGVARLAVPTLGDVCTIDLLGNGAPRRLVAVSRDPSQPITAEVPSAVLAGHATIYELGGISHVSVPLLVRGRVVGAITLGAPPVRMYARTDLELAEELARRAAIAVENARLYRTAKEAVRSREEFLAVAAHEIRGPVCALRLAVQALRRGQGDPEELLDTIEREERRLTRLVEQLVDLGRVQAGSLELVVEEVDLAEVVRTVSTRLAPELARSGSTLSTEVEGRAVGHWDRARLEQVAANLLSNAIKFGLGKPIEIGVRARDDRVFLTVRDHGIGIDEQAQEEIFEPFERAVPSRRYGGLGLGLYIVRTIVQALGGSIRVDSAPGEGAMFTVELPARSAS